jgi:hypothetical protein
MSLSTKDITMAAAIPSVEAFPFSDLPMELQVMIIHHDLDTDIDQRKNKLIIRLHRSQPCKGESSNRPKTRGARPTVQLPKLPAVYHTNRLFRYEALRRHQLHQLLSDNGLKPLFYRRASKVLFDPARDTVVFNLRDRAPSCLMLDTVLDNVFELTEKIRHDAFSLKIVFVIGPNGYDCASELHTKMLEYADRLPEMAMRYSSDLVRETIKGKKGIWQVTMVFGAER